MKQLKKITVKTVAKKGFNQFAESEAVGAERVIMTVYGRADKFEDSAGNSPSGDSVPYTKFRGDFVAFAGKLDEGEKFRSGNLILPGGAGGTLRELLSSDEITSANFGFQISTKKATGPAGYEFAVKALISEPAEADPLAPVARMVAEAAATGKESKRQGATTKPSGGRATAAGAK